MAEALKDKVEAAGHKIAETATKVGHRVGEKVEQVTDWAKQKSHQAGNRIDEAAQKVGNKAKETFGEGCATTRSVADIREHMEVIGSCGNRLGKVDHVDGDTIKLTKNDSPDGLHHLIPIAWVERVDEHVHLNKSCGDAAREWESV
jgi:hypothetical protein